MAKRTTTTTSKKGSPKDGSTEERGDDKVVEEEVVSAATNVCKRPRNDDDVLADADDWKDEMNHPTSQDDDKDNNDSVNNTNNDQEVREDLQPSSKYEVRQRMIARDEDGLMYHANIRRKMYGVNHQKTVSCLRSFDSFVAQNGNTDKDSTEKKDENDDNFGEPEWYYFVHFEGWKSLWDRWVSEDDVLEATPLNEDRMKETAQEHRNLQHELKEKNKKRKIQNGGLFIQLWKQRLDGLTKKWKAQDQKDSGSTSSPPTSNKRMAKKTKENKEKKKKQKTKSDTDMMKEQLSLAVHSCLTHRTQTQIQAIPLAFGLKRILVEDWEIINSSARNQEHDDKSNNDDSMVHVLPTKVTVRNALSLYLREKGIMWDGKVKPTKPPATKNDGESMGEGDHLSSDTNQVVDKIVPVDDTGGEQANQETSSNLVIQEEIVSNGGLPSPSQHQNVLRSKEDNTLSTKSESGALTKEWTDMADGIAMYFEQALKLRLLYPSEVSQLALLEEAMSEGSELDKIDIYGCEHLLRLITIMPRILDQQYRDAKQKRLEQKQKATTEETTSCTVTQDQQEDDEGFAEVLGVILAKLQDLARFLQKNQSTLFCSRYRKKSEEEIKFERKVQKRQERRLKNMLASSLQEVNPTDQQNVEDVNMEE
ncbi:MRG family protein [Nitzschia inconspicua]|uniref:MRG family protein n=1 Tax=Nitzschia inconspicua TaxID=303405 RepID=A0A9K3L946_9STRA|nr:MRG family protein [Nitzschia inconspicua]